MRNVSDLQNCRKNITRPACCHLFLPGFMNGAFTNRTVDKPAERTGLKFPGRALGLSLRGTFFNHPAWLQAFLVFLYSGNQEKHLSLHMGRNGSPALFITVDSLNGRSQKLAHLKLGLTKHLTVLFKFFTIHGQLPEVIYKIEIDLFIHFVVPMSTVN
jgi:hypothetical protein